MQLETFSGGKSILHALDPRLKLLVYLPFVFLTALTDERGVAAAMLLTGLLLAGMGRLYGGKLLERLAVVNVFMALLWLTLPFSVEGETIWRASVLRITREGVLLSLLITVKTNAIALFTIALPGTSTIIALTHAMLHLGMPEKPVTLFYFFYRYIGVVNEESEKMSRMLRVRGFRTQTGIHTIRVSAYFIGMLFIRSYERSERVYNALVMRGFTGWFPMLEHFSLHPRDAAFATLMGVVLITTLLL